MQNYKEHIVLRLLSLMLIIAVALPSVVKFNHIFESHEHDICSNNTTVHIHAVDFDCEFYKFKLNNSYSFTFNEVSFVEQENNHKITTSQYQFISSHKHTGIELRGPPSLTTLFA